MFYKVIKQALNDDPHSWGIAKSHGYWYGVPRIGDGENRTPWPGLDQLRVSLGTRGSTCLDISTFVEKEYAEEIDLATFIQSMLVAPALEQRAIIPPSPTPEVNMVVQAVTTPRVAVTDKDKGVYVSSPKKVPSTRPKGIVVEVPAATTPMIEEEEDEVFQGDTGLTLRVADIRLASQVKMNNWRLL